MSPFDEGSGKHKHRVSEDTRFKAPKRCQSYNLDEATIAGLAELAQDHGCNKSAMIRILVQKAQEMSNAQADVA
jgi:hypothetical protein